MKLDAARQRRIAMRITLCCFFAIISTTTGCLDNSDDRKIRVFAAASTTEAMEEICQLFASRENVIVQTSFASSSTLATQILNGANANVFLSANMEWAAKLKNENLSSKLQETIGNQLVAIGLKKNDSAWRPSSLADLSDDRVKRIAIADPDAVPAGIYTKRALERIGIWKKIKHKLVYGTHVRHTLGQVEAGSVDIGIVYKTDARISKLTEVIFWVDTDQSGEIAYSLALLTNQNSHPAAGKLYDFISSDVANRIFEKHGFVVTNRGK